MRNRYKNKTTQELKGLRFDHESALYPPWVTPNEREKAERAIERINAELRSRGEELDV